MDGVDVHIPGIQLAVAITAGNYLAEDQWIPPTGVLREVVLASVQETDELVSPDSSSELHRTSLEHLRARPRLSLSAEADDRGRVAVRPQHRRPARRRRGAVAPLRCARGHAALSRRSDGPQRSGAMVRSKHQ